MFAFCWQCCVNCVMSSGYVMCVCQSKYHKHFILRKSKNSTSRFPYSCSLQNIWILVRIAYECLVQCVRISACVWCSDGQTMYISTMVAGYTKNYSLLSTARNDSNQNNEQIAMHAFIALQQYFIIFTFRIIDWPFNCIIVWTYD